jgi:cell division protein FtsI/penicillin-binding protein 2
MKAVLKAGQSEYRELARGEIVDHFGKVLALDTTKYILEFNPVDPKENKTLLASQLAEIFDFKNKTLLDKNSSQTLVRNLSKEEAEKIKALKSKQLYLRKMTTRFYPQGKLASHILGYVDKYGEAKQGIENRFKDLLLDDPKGKLALSIDSRLQVLSEKALKEQIETTESERGTVIVMDTHTGEILAWAIYPDFNPNNYYDAAIEHTKNWAIVDVYQPGSIFKIITVASALDAKTIDQNYKFTDKGYLQIDKNKISNHDYVPGSTQPMELDIKGLFARSSNPFAAHIALKMGSELFYNYIKLFGFGNKSRIELLGESKGILKKPSLWKKLDTATTAIGHGAISVTPIQILAAVNTIPNHGIWIKPTLLKIDENKQSNSTEQSIQVITSDTADFVARQLTEAIAFNTSERHTIAGNIPGLKVAGKTGTAEKITSEGAYSKRQTVASFFGFFPAEEPRFSILVVIDDPKTSGGWGDTVAGPVFNKVAGYCRTLYW